MYKLLNISKYVAMNYTEILKYFKLVQHASFVARNIFDILSYIIFVYLYKMLYAMVTCFMLNSINLPLSFVKKLH